MKDKPTKEDIAKQYAQLYADYYLHEIFNITADLDIMFYAEIVRFNGPSLITLDTDILERELTALNIELFGLAWLDYNYGLFEEGKQDSIWLDFALCTEIMFEKSRLDTIKSSDIWSAAGFYNRTIFEAAIAQNDSVDWSIFRDIPAYYERATSSKIPIEITELLTQHFREGFDEFLGNKVDDKECSLRLSNRVQSIQPWRDGIMIPQKLSLAFAERLGFVPNSETIFLFQRLVLGLYKNARDYINAVIDYGTWELARKAAIDLRQSFLERAHELIEKQKRSDKPVE